ncbi:MAG: hypothetical protein ABI854_04890 [Betaproteobacteria bacterium]
MSKMHDQRYRLEQFYAESKEDDPSARKAYDAMSETQMHVFDAMADGRNRIDAVLTKDQREQLGHRFAWRGRGEGR